MSPGKDPLDRRLDEEIRFHLEQEIASGRYQTDWALLRNPFKNAPFQAVFWSGVSSYPRRCARR